MIIIDRRGKLISFWEKTRPFLIFFSCLFGLALALRKFMYSRGIKKKTRLQAKVISVGNITLGGTGKTPLAEYIARKCKENNKKTVILSRGYGGGDEIMLFSKRNKDIPVLPGKNRRETGKEAVSKLGAEVIILDDGFQHWSLERDLDIVTLDTACTLPVWKDRLLPAGTLREKINSLRRTDIFVLTKCAKIDESAEGAGSGIDFWLTFLKEINPKAPVFFTSHKPVGFIDRAGKSSPLDFIKGRDVIAFSGIARPEAFEDTLKGLGARVTHSFRYPDHYAYSEEDLKKIREIVPRGALVITTEKDLIRINSDILGEQLLALVIELEFLKDNATPIDWCCMKQSNRSTISAIVITKNEEKNIERCLSGISWADEIIVVDSESTDKTVELAGKFTPNVFIHPWEGYSQQKNFALDKAACEWVLSVDSDEVVEENLKEEILKILSTPHSYTGFYIPRKNFVGRRWIRFGSWYPDYTLRLFKKGEGRFEKRHVHEAVMIFNKKGYLKTPLIHCTYRDLRDYAQRQLHYACLAGREMQEEGKKATLPGLFFHPIYNFIKCYLFRLGFLDGYLGLRLAISSSGYVFKKYMFLKRRYENTN